MRTLKHLLVGATLLALPFGFARMPMANAATLGDVGDNLSETVGETGLSTQATLPETIGRLIGILLSFLGIIFLLLTIYAGFLWMTASGEPKQVEKARTLLTQAVVGLVILLSAYAISSFVIDSLTEATAT